MCYLIRDFKHLDFPCKGSTAGHRQSREFPECVDENFLLQMVEEPAMKGAMLDLVKLKTSLGCSDHTTVGFRISGVTRRVCSKLTTLEF